MRESGTWDLNPEGVGGLLGRVGKRPAVRHTPGSIPLLEDDAEMDLHGGSWKDTIR
jgi:hypothetical protein